MKITVKITVKNNVELVGAFAKNNGGISRTINGKIKEKMNWKINLKINGKISGTIRGKISGGN